jgi:dTMP kinase
MPDDILPGFIVLEGIDGAGTSTQIGILGRALELASRPHWTTYEPTDRPEGLIIRSILRGELRRDGGTLARLFAADRNEHVYGALGIAERIGRGETVVCDRYVLSSLAYQGAACGLELPLELNRRFPLPELLLYFDVAPDISLGRIADRPSRDIFEEAPFQSRVRAMYEKALELYADGPMRIVRVDASRPLAEVAETVLREVGRTLGMELPRPGLKTRAHEG